jgi:hypothetical protein
VTPVTSPSFLNLNLTPVSSHKGKVMATLIAAQRFPNKLRRVVN